MKQKQKDPRTQSAIWWIVFCIVMLAMNWMIYVSTKRVFPELMELTIGCSIITVVVSAYNHGMADEPDFLLRTAGIVAIILIVVLDVANLYGHVMLARGVSAAHAGEIEYRDHVKFQQEMADKAAQRQKQLSDARAQENQSQAQLAQAETRRLNAVPLSQRGLYARSTVPKPSQGATASKVEDPTLASLTAPIAPPTKTEASEKQDWYSYFSIVLLLGVGVSVVSAFGLSSLRKWDANKNNIPDFIERIFQSDEALCQRLHPDEYAVLVGQRAQAAALGN